MDRPHSKPEDILKDLIFNTLLFDAGRGGHTTETLIAAIRDTGLVDVDSVTLDSTLRIRVGELLEAGELDMRSDGLLMLAPELPERDIEKFCGAWWCVITPLHIGGPFKTQREAISDALIFQNNLLA